MVSLPSMRLLDFLYPQKYNLLKPYIEIIRENWRKVLDSPTELMFLVRRRNGNSGGSSISSFLSSLAGGTPSI